MVKNNAYNEKIAMNFFLEISYYCINSAELHSFGEQWYDWSKQVG